MNRNREERTGNVAQREGGSEGKRKKHSRTRAQPVLSQNSSSAKMVITEKVQNQYTGGGRRENAPVESLVRLELGKRGICCYVK